METPTNQEQTPSQTLSPALAFAKMGMEELQQRLKVRGKATEEETVKKFFADQGINFGEIDTKAVLDLVKQHDLS